MAHQTRAKHPPHQRVQQQSKQASGHQVYGRNPVLEVLKAGKRQVNRVLIAIKKNQHDDAAIIEICKFKHISYQLVEHKEIDNITEGGAHQGVVALVGEYPHYEIESVFNDGGKKKLVLALDCIQDPQNFGTLCRSAHAFGVKEIIIPKDRSCSVTSVVCKASAGRWSILK